MTGTRPSGIGIIGGIAMAAWVGLTIPVAANDANVTLEGGGLVLSKTADIAMVREDLDLSVDLIKVRYVFRNRSEKDVTTRVAFPMPHVEGGMFENSPFAIPDQESPNFVRFKATVDGKPVATKLQEVARDAKGNDITGKLRKSGQSPNFMMAPRPENQEWTYEATYHWEQAFPAGKDVVVEHSYVPVTGTGMGRNEDFCVDKGTDAAIKRLWPKDRNPGEHFASSNIAYVLGTARTWAGPIGEFHLTVRKADPKGVASLCLNGIRKTGPTTFEFSARDYVPKDLLRVRFVRPPTAEEINAKAP